ncbi:DUF2905 domain-containing protein [Neomoorella thermoacetica]|uniref:DUF2905 domain-containing protein n=4 Tax=Neomoorella thermoacetica TaxID=1525 RepID=A0A1D7XBX6_NEOTH|nr:DUF2905 domain-containing protein [Moorella thermoacetica]MDN5326253.1 hypothetical protein [Moorella sp. (in: firmicutes)]AKX94499.1 hypothetical protein MOTHE_c17060 [Moorella thermoacetica]AKX97135.1 hypothetical protein MOTHA_c17890 [Moorella thermoacetica]AOQ24424.1 hypothetical protein Maut_01989 [Moorella thermoacetica]APC08889.1 hypothetical protein MTJW_17300 [Moorella thermoacetica]
MGDWSFFGKMLLGMGLFLALMGLLLLGLGKLFSIGRLPGDIYIQRGNFTFYFPLVTSLLLSLILTVILNLLFRR